MKGLFDGMFLQLILLGEKNHEKLLWKCSVAEACGRNLEL